MPTSHALGLLSERDVSALVRGDGTDLAGFVTVWALVRGDDPCACTAIPRLADFLGSGARPAAPSTGTRWDASKLVRDRPSEIGPKGGAGSYAQGDTEREQQS